MNTPEETTLLAAADRLRRVKGCVLWREICAVYGNRDEDEVVKAIDDDNVTLADAMLSRIPAGPEPVAIDAVVGENWILHHANRQVMTATFPNQKSARDWNENREWIGESCYPTEAAARLALAWRMFRAEAGRNLLNPSDQ